MNVVQTPIKEKKKKTIKIACTDMIGERQRNILREYSLKPIPTQNQHTLKNIYIAQQQQRQ